MISFDVASIIDVCCFFFFFQAEDGIRDVAVTGVQSVLFRSHSSFFDAKQFALLREDQRGKYYGVGMIVAPQQNHTVVMAPYAGAPAYNAGIRPGDVIV